MTPQAGMLIKTLLSVMFIFNSLNAQEIWLLGKY